jgi:hypothetical protein
MPSHPHLRFGCLQAASSSASTKNQTTMHALAPIPRRSAATKLRCQHHAPHATSTAPRAQFKKHCKEAQAVRTCEIERLQTWRQCARQCLHTRSSDLVPCKAASSRASLTTDPAHNAHSALSQGRRRSAATRSETQHSARHTTRVPRPKAEAQKRRPQVPWRLSVVRLGGSARASASTPASPKRFPAGRKHPTLNHDPTPTMHALAPSRQSAATRSEPPSTTHHMQSPHRRTPRPRATAQKPQGCTYH